VVQKVREFSLAAIAKVLPRCRCGGTMRPDFVGFGEPVQELEQAISEAASCDWMLIVGTSGVVYPAASLPRHAKAHGAFIVEVNPKESEFSSWVDVFIRGIAGEVLPRFVTEMKQVHA
jgi:NAD-dependent deacetylase